MKKLLLGSSFISQFAQVVPITLFIGIIYFIIRMIYLKKEKISIHYKKASNR